MTTTYDDWKTTMPEYEERDEEREMDEPSEPDDGEGLLPRRAVFS